MTTTNIDELIKNHNPFIGHTVVTKEQIWGQNFPDAPQINAHVSEQILKAISKINLGEIPTIGMTITAEKGLGKSHIISRIRHQLKQDGTGLFIYMNRYDNLRRMKHQFLSNITSSLTEIGSQGATQWQELAAALINQAKKFNYTPAQYIDTFPSWLHKYSLKVIEHLTEAILAITPNINNPYIVRAIIWTLSPQHTNYASYWLSGSELTETQGAMMGLPNIKTGNKENESFSNACEIINLISYYKVPVICFDELDIATTDKNNYTPAMVVASLAKDLYSNIRKGLLLLAMYPETWKYQVKVLPQAEAVIDRIGGEPIDLKYLDGDDIITIVSQWLQEFYQANNLTPPHPVYPFNPEELHQFGDEKPTVRAVLKWCADNFSPEAEKFDFQAENQSSLQTTEADIIQNSDVYIEKQHPVDPAFHNEVEIVKESIDVWMQDNAAIADALDLAFNTLIGKEVEGVMIENITGFAVKPCYIDFKIIGKENGNTVKIGVAILLEEKGANIQKTLEQLIDYETLDITRGCLIRAKKIDIDDGESQNYLMNLVKEKEGQWIILHEEDIISLLAIRFVYDQYENYQLTAEQIFDFIEKRKLASNSFLIKEIISYRFFCTKATLAIG